MVAVVHGLGLFSQSCQQTSKDNFRKPEIGESLSCTKKISISIHTVSAKNDQRIMEMAVK